MSHNYRDGGKGDMPRPIPNKEQFEKSWDNIFGKKEKNFEPVPFGGMMEVEDDDFPTGS